MRRLRGIDEDLVVVVTNAAQRWPAVEIADLVFVIDGGRAVEDGPLAGWARKGRL